MKEQALGPGNEVQEAVRAKIKAAELSAEKAQQAALEAADIKPKEAALRSDAAARNLAAYGSHLGAQLPDEITGVLLARFEAIG